MSEKESNTIQTRKITVKGNIAKLYEYYQWDRSYSWNFPKVKTSTLENSMPITFTISFLDEEECNIWIEKVLPKFGAEIIEIKNPRKPEA